MKNLLITAALIVAGCLLVATFGPMAAEAATPPHVRIEP